MSASGDLIQHPSADPPKNWTENLIFTASDPGSGLALYVHMSRLTPHVAVWEADFAVYLPDDQLLVSRTFGCDPTGSAASTGNLVFACDVPLERWSLRFDGMTRRVDRGVPAAGPVADGAVERVQLDVTLEGLHEAWTLGDEVRKQSWGHFHLEQACRVRGRLSCEDRTVDLDCAGFRDHTYGPRDYSPLVREAWANCVFPSGRMFMALHVEEIDTTHRVNTGFAVEGGSLYGLEPSGMPLLTVASGDPAPFELKLSTERGMLSVEGRQTHAMALQLHAPVGMSLGVEYDNPDAVVLVEGPAEYRCDGEVGFGWLERLCRVGALRPPSM